jgi:hypothetical protein
MKSKLPERLRLRWVDELKCGEVSPNSQAPRSRTVALYFLISQSWVLNDLVRSMFLSSFLGPELFIGKVLNHYVRRELKNAHDYILEALKSITNNQQKLAV